MIVSKNTISARCANQVIAGNCADNDAKAAPIPRLTKIIGNAQQNTVDSDVNKLKKGNSFFITASQFLSHYSHYSQ